jgi:hypothetical protein
VPVDGPVKTPATHCLCARCFNAALDIGGRIFYEKAASIYENPILTKQRCSRFYMPHRVYALSSTGYGVNDAIRLCISSFRNLHAGWPK